MISKHIIRSIFSLAVLLFAASCQKDPDGSAPDGNNLTLLIGKLCSQRRRNGIAHRTHTTGG